MLLGAYEVPGYGGAATTGYQLFERLLADGSLRPSWVNLMGEADAEYFRFALGEGAGNPGGHPGVHDARLAAPLYGPQPALAALVAELDPDVVMAKGHVAAWLLGRAAPGRPLIFVTTGSRSVKQALAKGQLVDAVTLRQVLDAGAPLPFPLQRFEREAVERADLIVTHSTLVRDLYARMFPGARGKLHPVVAWDVPGLGEARATAPPAAVRPWAERDIRWMAVASSWTRPEKNLPLLRDLVERRGGPAVHVVGELPDELPGAVCHGLLPADELAALLGRARVLVCPSAFDATPGILFEASLAGCNLVASRNCGAHAVCAPSLLAEPPQLEGYLAALDRALAKREIDFGPLAITPGSRRGSARG